MPVGNNLNLKRERIIPLKNEADTIPEEKAEKVTVKKEVKEVQAKGKATKVKKGEKKKDRKAKPAEKAEPVEKINLEEKAKEEVKEEKSNQALDMGILDALEDGENLRYGVENIPSKRKAVKKTKIEFTGELTISHIHEIHKRVEEVFTAYNIYSLALKNINELDLSFIQLLHTYKEYLEAEGKEVKITADLPNELKELIITSGFSPLLFPSDN